MKNLKYLISALTLGAALAAPGMSYGEDAAAASDFSVRNNRFANPAIRYFLIG